MYVVGAWNSEVNAKKTGDAQIVSGSSPALGNAQSTYDSSIEGGRPSVRLYQMVSKNMDINSILVVRETGPPHTLPKIIVSGDRRSSRPYATGQDHDLSRDKSLMIIRT